MMQMDNDKKMVVDRRQDNVSNLAAGTTIDNDQQSRIFLYTIVLIFCALLTGYYFLSEKVPVNDGFGWDGARYARMVGNLDSDLSNKKISSYYIQRILPSFIVSIPARLTGIPVTREYIIYGFVTLNIMCIYIGSFMWLKISSKMHFNRIKTTISYILLFGFYWIIKGAAYYPVLTDVFAFTLSIVMIYFYLNNQTIGLSSTILAGLFAWPSTVYTGAFLLLFPLGSRLLVNNKWNIFMRRFVSIATVVLLFAISIILVIGIGKVKYKLLSHKLPVLPMISFMFTLSYVYFIARLAINSLIGEARTIKLEGMRFKGVIIWVFVFAVGLIVQRWLSVYSDFGLNMSLYIAGCVMHPLLNIVADITYYGAAWIFLLIGLGRVLKACHDLGLGIFLVVIFSLALNLYPESRMIISGFPFVVLGISMVFPLHHLKLKHWSLLILVQLACSKIWLRIGASAIDYLHLDQYPAQYFFLNLGPWMSHQAYLIQLTLSLVIFVVFYYLFVKCAVTTENQY